MCIIFMDVQYVYDTLSILILKSEYSDYIIFCLLKYKTFSIFELFIRLNRANLSKKLR